MKRYFVQTVDTGEIVNEILWDGVTPYDPGPGYVLVPAPEQN